MTHPGAPRDVDLNDWLDGIGFKPADTVAKQVGHAAVREFVANIGVVLHEMLPPGRDKTIAFTLLEDVLLRANRALALGGGPVDQSDETIRELQQQIAASPVGLPRDHRYEAEQRGESVFEHVTDAPQDVAGVPLDKRAGNGWELVSVITGPDIAVHMRPEPRPGVLLQTGKSEPVELTEQDVEDLRRGLAAACVQAWPGPL